MVALASPLMPERLRGVHSLSGAIVIAVLAIITALVPARMWLEVADSTESIDRAKAGYLLAVTGLGAAVVGTIGAAGWSTPRQRGVRFGLGTVLLMAGVVVFFFQQVNPPSNFVGLLWFSFVALSTGAGTSWVAESAWVSKQKMSQTSESRPVSDQVDGSRKIELADVPDRSSPLSPTRAPAGESDGGGSETTTAD